MTQQYRPGVGLMTTRQSPGGPKVIDIDSNFGPALQARLLRRQAVPLDCRLLRRHRRRRIQHRQGSRSAAEEAVAVPEAVVPAVAVDPAAGPTIDPARGWVKSWRSQAGQFSALGDSIHDAGC